MEDQMAAGGLPVVRGNSDNQPMTPPGHATVQKVGKQLAALGGPDEIVPATSRRAVETAGDVADQTGAAVGDPQSGLESHALGNMEGEQRTPQVKRYMADLIRKAPNLKIPGQGALSNRPGESFNDFRMRALKAVGALMQKLAQNPTERVLVPTSSQVIKLVRSWAAAGCPDDLSIDHRPMMQEDAGKPGSIERFFPQPSGTWELTPFNPKDAKAFLPGIYFMRHGETSAVQAQNASAGQKARAQIIGHIRAGNYHGARDVAKAAHAAGHLGDDEISTAIDEALPGANDAQRLPSDQLLAAASAAGPQKRQELMPAVHQRFANLASVSPEGKSMLRSHLGRLGVRV
jgi:broad specificity phosphatase PhoE